MGAAKTHTRVSAGAGNITLGNALRILSMASMESGHSDLFRAPYPVKDQIENFFICALKKKQEYIIGDYFLCIKKTSHTHLPESTCDSKITGQAVSTDQKQQGNKTTA